ncbi:MAG: hypothetical protein RLZZ507_123 [Cyanobacteriota bacterium]|jgi:hypothetical protein
MEYSHPVNPLILDILIQTKIITQDNSITSISLYFYFVFPHTENEILKQNKEIGFSTTKTLH